MLCWDVGGVVVMCGGSTPFRSVLPICCRGGRQISSAHRGSTRLDSISQPLGHMAGPELHVHTGRGGVSRLVRAWDCPMRVGRRAGSYLSGMGQTVIFWMGQTVIFLSCSKPTVFFLLHPHPDQQRRLMRIDSVLLAP